MFKINVPVGNIELTASFASSFYVSTFIQTFRVGGCGPACAQELYFSVTSMNIILYLLSPPNIDGRSSLHIFPHPNTNVWMKFQLALSLTLMEAKIFFHSGGKSF